MALFNDGLISNLADWQSYDNGLSDMAAAEGIDLIQKAQAAQDSIALEILKALLNASGRFSFGSPWLSDSAWTRRIKGVSDVVVTAPLQRWHLLETLRLAYENAYGSQVNERYKAKRDQFAAQAGAAAITALQIGIGLVFTPLPKPLLPQLSMLAGTAPTGTWYVSVAWTACNGQEGAPSDVASLSTTDETVLNVYSGAPPANVSGWNLYVGATPSDLARQNATPIPVQTNWVLPSDGLISGPLPGSGQQPDWYVTGDRVLQRG